MTPKTSNTRKVWKYVKLLLTLAILLIGVTRVAHVSPDSVYGLIELCLHIYEHNFSFLSLTIFLVGVTYVKYRPRKVYMVDFACYKPDPESAVKLSWASFVDLTTQVGTFTEENVTFQKKVLERSGLGQETYLPKSFMKIPPLKATVEEIKKEARMYMIVVIDELLGKSKVKAKDIGILIVNSSLFHPTPSPCAMLINHYDFREDVRCYNLGAMGCSAGLIALDLAARLLQVHANTNALVVSLEQGTQSNWYMGNERSMLLGNCIFRAGVAAMLLSNKRSARSRASYQLIHTVRTNKAAEDKCYSCVYQKEDSKNITGIALSKDLMSVAGKALNTNITTLGPLVLPYSEQLLYFITLVARKTFKMKKFVKQYVPDFKLAFEHFCIHPGGKAVLDEVEKSDLQLSKWHMEPSRMTLYRFGNTSSSGLWYVLAYLEARGRIKKGDRIWQIAFGSGFKCNSVVWRAMKTVDPPKEMNPWVGEIDNLPTYE